MYYTSALYAMSVGNKLLITVALVVFSTILIAGQLITSIDYDALIKEEIYEDGVEWRQAEANEYQWRVSANEEDSGRIKYGSDPEFEQLRSRLSTNIENSRSRESYNMLRLEF